MPAICTFYVSIPVYRSRLGRNGYGGKPWFHLTLRFYLNVSSGVVLENNFCTNQNKSVSLKISAVFVTEIDNVNNFALLTTANIERDIKC